MLFLLLTFLFAICTPQVNLNLEIMFVSVCVDGNHDVLAHIYSKTQWLQHISIE
jgi:hypothetical protein